MTLTLHSSLLGETEMSTVLINHDTRRDELNRGHHDIITLMTLRETETWHGAIVYFMTSLWHHKWS